MTGRLGIDAFNFLMTNHKNLKIDSPCRKRVTVYTWNSVYMELNVQLTYQGMGSIDKEKQKGKFFGRKRPVIITLSLDFN